MDSQPEPLLPFSLVCSECDAGMDIANQAEAESLGWSDIEFAPDLPMANYLGLCPTCKGREDSCDLA